MKREKSMHFQSGIYPPDVMVCLRERAEELGLKLEVRDTMMYISVQSHLPNHEEVGFLVSNERKCVIRVLKYRLQNWQH